MTIALAMSRELIRSGPTPEDAALAAALQAAGYDVCLEAWDGDADWSKFELVLIRSCWDYHLRPGEFRAWLALLEQETVRLANPADLVRWNMDKTYLRELESRGLAIVPTLFRGALSESDLDDARLELGSEELVLKPSIGATAFETHRLTREAELPVLPALEGGAVWLVQPFVPEILREGEWSVICFAGALSHSGVKRARPGEFRVQDSFGGTLELAPAPSPVLELAERTVGTLAPAPLYARVDIVVPQGSPRLMEVELIEPQLFLTESPRALAGFVSAIESAMRAP